MKIGYSRNTIIKILQVLTCAFVLLLVLGFSVLSCSHHTINCPKGHPVNPHYALLSPRLIGAQGTKPTPKRIPIDAMHHLLFAYYQLHHDNIDLGLDHLQLAQVYHPKDPVLWQQVIQATERVHGRVRASAMAQRALESINNDPNSYKLTLLAGYYALYLRDFRSAIKMLTPLMQETVPVAIYNNACPLLIDALLWEHQREQAIDYGKRCFAQDRGNALPMAGVLEDHGELLLANAYLKYAKRYVTEYSSFATERKQENTISAIDAAILRVRVLLGELPIKRMFQETNTPHQRHVHVAINSPINSPIETPRDTNHHAAVTPDAVSLALLSYQAGESEGKSKAVLEQLFYLYDKNPFAIRHLNALAFVLADTNNDLATAQVFARRAYRINAFEPAIIDTLGWVLWKRGEITASRMLLTQAHHMVPDNTEISAHFNTVYGQQKR